MSAEIGALIAEESFRHSWDMSDERLIDGAWVAGLCCECGDFVPYGQEVAHVAAALAPLVAAAKAEAFREAADLVGQERAAHLIASARAPAAGALFRVEQALRTTSTPPAVTHDGGDDT